MPQSATKRISHIHSTVLTRVTTTLAVACAGCGGIASVAHAFELSVDFKIALVKAYLFLRHIHSQNMLVNEHILSEDRAEKLSSCS